MTVYCLDPGPDRGPAHRRARSRPARRLRHRRDAAHGRRLRRQGEPGLRLGGARRARRARDRRAHASCRLDRDDDFVLTGKRHDFRADWRGRLRRPRPRRRLRRHAQRALRLLGRSLARRRRPRDVPRRQLLLAARRPHRLAAAEDQHRLQHRLPRLRRPAGHAGDRAGDGRDRARARPRSARRAQGQFLPRRRRPHALRPDGRGLRDAAGDDRGARSLERLSRAARRDPRIQRRRARSSSAASR